jgi:response regulator RpfG family c-di-GMP phosphodiesterase
MSKINEKVLVVDDDPEILKTYKKQFSAVVDIQTAEEPWLALEIIKRSGPFAVLVSDFKLPGMNGLELIAEAEKIAPDTVKILLTGYADLELATKAINEGRVFRFLTKPCPHKDMASAFIAGINYYRRTITERDTLERTFNGCVQMLSDVISLSTPMAFSRARKLKDLSAKVAPHIGIGDLWDFETAAMFSQLGYVTLPHQLLEKITLKIQPNAVEEQMLAKVPEAGEKLLRNIPRLEKIARIVRYCEKNYDGSGYPEDDVSLEDLPLESRALKILEAILRLEEETEDFDVISTKIRNGKGSFDPNLTEMILAELEISSLAAINDEIEVIKVSVADLRIGDILLADVETAEGKLLFSGGNEVTQIILTKLINYSEITKVVEPLTVKRKA